MKIIGLCALKRLREVKFHTVNMNLYNFSFHKFFYHQRGKILSTPFWTTIIITPIKRDSLAVLDKMILKFLSSSGVLSILGVTSSNRLISNSWNLTEPLAFPNSPPSYISLLDRASRISQATSTTPKVPPVLVMLLKIQSSLIHWFIISQFLRT